MARAYPSSQPPDYDDEPRGNEWQELRRELVALLEEVESRVTHTRAHDPGIGSIAQRMRALREHVAGGEPDERHREALRSVKRAVERLAERDEGDAPSPARRRDDHPPNPRDTLQSAIEEIRARRRELDSGSRPAPAMVRERVVEPRPRTPEVPFFGELAHAVEDISGRLERLEGELRTHARSQTGNVKEIAEQVAQLSHVVELLAGAVGETGQVKRLEAQIAALTQLVSQGPRIDLGALTRRLDDLAATIGRLFERQDGAAVAQRLDDVTATMGRLADLQVQFANRVDASAQAASGLGEGLRRIEAGVRDSLGSAEARLAEGMRALENGVRNVYDRIDAIEKSTAMPSLDLDRLTEEMARFTEAMKNLQQPHELIELADVLHQRIAALENDHREVGGLKADVEALRTAVIEAVEPRFAALEMQLEALSDRVGERPADISVGQLEAQVRQLVARMDQTGEQLTGLARLYRQPVEREPAPDFAALADMVAARTSEAVAQQTQPHATGAGLDEAGIDEIERRISRLVNAAALEKPSDDLAGIETSIREVNERLARLEASLAEQARQGERDGWPRDEGQADHHLASVAPPAPEPDEPEPTAPFAGPPDVAATPAHEARPMQPPPRGDAMPANPASEAPLIDRPFVGGVRAALEVKNGTRKLHPGLTDGPPAAEDAAAARPVPGRPLFDPSTIERPPRPVSSLDLPEPTTFEAPSPPPAAPVAAPQPEPPASDPVPSANTFIAAARRAAQRQGGGGTAGGSGSLIARALQSLQAGKSAEAKPVKDEPRPAKAQQEGRDRKRRALAGDKPSPTAWRPDDEQGTEPAAPVAPAGPRAPEPIALDQEATAPQDAPRPRASILLRYRRPILLGAAAVAIVLLTLNLINQRLGRREQTPAAPEPAAAETSALQPMPGALSSEPLANVAPEVSGPRVIPIVDSLATASIDPGAARGFTPTSEALPPTTAFAAFAPSEARVADVAPAAIAAIDGAAMAPSEAIEGPAPAAIASPVQVEMPPEALGPEPLRRAAANGDARAQFEIAAIYTEGRAVPEDLEQAAIWYERAAAQGFAPAQYRLGNLYENGRGVAKDLNQAKLWYQRAAEAGNRMAMHNLAALYAGGEMGKQDFAAAAQWFEQAAMRGMRDSQFNLGMLYARGLGVPQNLEQSYKWFALAALRGDADAAKARDDIARSLDAETVQRLTDEIAAFRPAEIDLVANYAPIGTWSDTFDPGETITNPEVVRSVQAALNGLGYDVGTPDGLAGPRTAEAIRAFERATGMSESGAINPRLLAVLGSQPV